jgi:hypothetical protein
VGALWQWLLLLLLLLLLLATRAARAPLEAAELEGKAAITAGTAVAVVSTGAGFTAAICLRICRGAAAAAAAVLLVSIDRLEVLCKPISVRHMETKNPSSRAAVPRLVSMKSCQQPQVHVRVTLRKQLSSSVYTQMTCGRYIVGIYTSVAKPGLL